MNVQITWVQKLMLKNNKTGRKDLFGTMLYSLTKFSPWYGIGHSPGSLVVGRNWLEAAVRRWPKHFFLKAYFLKVYLLTKLHYGLASVTGRTLGSLVVGRKWSEACVRRWSKIHENISSESVFIDQISPQSSIGHSPGSLGSRNWLEAGVRRWWRHFLKPDFPKCNS